MRKRISKYKSALIVMLLSFFSISIMVFAGHQHAEDEGGFLEMDLEQLMSVELGDLSPMGIHHTHDKGESMFGYSFSFMKMNGNRDGTSNVGKNKVLDDFMVTPTEMTMNMHMFGAMYAPTDTTTVRPWKLAWA